MLNACRSLRFAAEGVWSSKAAAGRWALDAAADSDRGLVAEALNARAHAKLDARRVDAFLARAVERLGR